MLLIDSIFEFAAGAALIAFAGTLGDWLRIPAMASVAAGLIFIVAGVAILAMRGGRADACLIRMLAWANVAGGVVGWAALMTFWQQFDPGGRAMVGTTADMFLAIGAFELLALRYSSVSAA
jgi:hypothetical protein